MKALKVLGEMSTQEIESHLSDIIEDGLLNKVLEMLEVERRPTITTTATSGYMRPVDMPIQDDGELSVAGGLGDLEPEEVEPVEDEDDLLPETGGLTDESLRKDMEVEDETHEAKGEPGTAADVDEDGFAQIVGLPPVKKPTQEPVPELHHDEFVDHRILKRKKKNFLPPRKGRVAALTTEEESKSPIADM